MYRMLMCLISMECPEDLSLNQRIKSYQENRIEIGTPIDAEEAKKWENRVYLATYQRSGNHWMRYLIEEATGIATSSAYIDPDPQHLETVFPWGGYCCDRGYEGRSRYPMQGEIAVVKTHYPAILLSWFDQLPYSQTIRIIRHPIDCFYSLYLWQKNFWKEAPEFYIPKEKLRKYIRSWRRFQEHWDSAPNVHTIRYEDLCSNPVAYLKLVLEKIGYQVDLKDIERAVEKYPPTGGLLKHLAHFTEEDLSIIQSELGDLMQEYNYKLLSIE